MLHDERDCRSSHPFAESIGAVIRLGMAEMRNDFFPVIGRVQRLSASWADASATQSVLDFMRPE